MDSPANDPEMQKLIAMEVADIMEGMTTPTNWPDPNRPGVPMFPERDGFHIIGRLAWKWHAASKLWDGVANPDEFGTFSYVGPCITPAQINEMLAAERERCADICRAMAFDNAYERMAREALEVAETEILNLGSAS